MRELLFFAKLHEALPVGTVPIYQALEKALCFLFFSDMAFHLDSNMLLSELLAKPVS